MSSHKKVPVDMAAIKKLDDALMAAVKSCLDLEFADCINRNDSNGKDIPRWRMRPVQKSEILENCDDSQTPSVDAERLARNTDISDESVVKYAIAYVIPQCTAIKTTGVTLSQLVRLQTIGGTFLSDPRVVHDDNGLAIVFDIYSVLFGPPFKLPSLLPLGSNSQLISDGSSGPGSALVRLNSDKTVQVGGKVSKLYNGAKNALYRGISSATISVVTPAARYLTGADYYQKMIDSLAKDSDTRDREDGEIIRRGRKRSSNSHVPKNGSSDTHSDWNGDEEGEPPRKKTKNSV